MFENTTEAINQMTDNTMGKGKRTNNDVQNTTQKTKDDNKQMLYLLKQPCCFIHTSRINVFKTTFVIQPNMV
jgi:hypothetical protein